MHAETQTPQHYLALIKTDLDGSDMLCWFFSMNEVFIVKSFYHNLFFQDCVFWLGAVLGKILATDN